MIVLQTERLLFREMTEADAEHLVRLGQNPNVLRYLPDPPLAGVEEAVQLLKSVIFPQYANRIGRWAVIRRDTGEYIGCDREQASFRAEEHSGIARNPAADD